MSDEPKWARLEQDVNGRPIIRSNYDYVGSGPPYICPQCQALAYVAQPGARYVCDDCGHDSGPLLDQRVPLLLTSEEWDDLAEMVRHYCLRAVAPTPSREGARRGALAERIIEANQP